MNSLIEAFAWCILQVTLFSAAAGCVYLATRRLRQVSRGSLLVMSLATVGALTLLALSPWPQWGIATSALPTGEFAESDLTADDPITPDPIRPMRSDLADGAKLVTSREVAPADSVLRLPESQYAPAEIWLEARWLRYLVWAAWAACAFGVLRFIIGLIYVRRCRWAGTPVIDARLVRLFDALRSEIGIRQAVELRASSQLAVPATVGWRRPAVLLPATWPAWTEDQQRAVLAHELAHVRQRHFPAWLVSQIAVVTHYYHPLVHWLSRRLRLELELSADALAASLFTDRRQYAAALAGLALGPSRSPAVVAQLGLFMSRPLLMRRIAMLRQTDVPVHRFSRWKLGLAFMTLALVAVGVAGLRAAGKESATTKVVTQFRVARESKSNTTDERATMSDAAWRTFCNSQVALVKSDWLLQRAVQNLPTHNLPMLGSASRARGWLQRNLQVGFVGDSEIMSILAYCDQQDADQVKQIVDAVATAYFDEFKNREQARNTAQLTAFMQSFKRIRDQMVHAETEYVSNARELGGIPDDGGVSAIQLLTNRLDRIESELMRLESEQLEVQLGSKPGNKDFYAVRIEALTKQRDELLTQISMLNEQSMYSSRRRNELGQLQQTSAEMQSRLETLVIDREAPLRVELLHKALASDAFETTEPTTAK
jgi:beta-lactamase regulating signal transducer with metallopeptidase domain